MPDDLETYANSKPGYDLLTYATFHEEVSIGIGDPYTKPTHELPRHKGKQFGVDGPATPQAGLSAPSLGLQIPFTVPGDQYIEPLRLANQLARRSLQANSKAFVPSSGSNLIGAPGSLTGTFGPPTLLVDTDASTATRRPSTAPTARKNLYVNPPKQGGLGRMVQDNTIGGTTFNYMADEYCRGRRLEKALKKDARARIVKPFIGVGGPARNFKDIPSLAASGADPYRPLRASSAPVNKVAWRPNNPPMTGQGHGVIGKIAYCPAGPRSGAQRSSRYTRPFVPVGGTHSRMSMWTVNPYVYDARPPPNNDLSLLKP